MTTTDIAAECLLVLQDTIILFSASFITVGIVVGLLQTIFSIQDPGLPLLAKLVVFILIISNYGAEVFDRFALIFQNI